MPDLDQTLFAQAGMDQGGAAGGHRGADAAALQMPGQEAGGERFDPPRAFDQDPIDATAGIIVDASLAPQTPLHLLPDQTAQFRRRQDLGIPHQLITHPLGDGVGLGKGQTRVHQ